ncbi:hypothetical protein ACS0PU_008664 [Formica fusca]
MREKNAALQKKSGFSTLKEITLTNSGFHETGFHERDQDDEEKIREERSDRRRCGRCLERSRARSCSGLTWRSRSLSGSIAGIMGNGLSCCAYRKKKVDACGDNDREECSFATNAMGDQEIGHGSISSILDIASKNNQSNVLDKGIDDRVASQIFDKCLNN